MDAQAHLITETRPEHWSREDFAEAKRIEAALAHEVAVLQSLLDALRARIRDHKAARRLHLT